MRGLRGLWRLRGRTGGTTVLLLWRLLLATRALGWTVRGRWQMRLTAGARAGRGRWPRPHWFVLVRWRIGRSMVRSTAGVRWRRVSLLLVGSILVAAGRSGRSARSGGGRSRRLLARGTTGGRWRSVGTRRRWCRSRSLLLLRGRWWWRTSRLLGRGTLLGRIAGAGTLTGGTGRVG